MGLQKYQTKRKFGKTTEPKGKSRVKSYSRFVVQKHNASHLHYDFRLELPEKINKGEIVLKSWAVPKGVPQKAGVKSLAVQTEDHPVEYINFHGVIPKGNYGAGTVEIWDKGKFILIEAKKKSLKFELKGKKLKGKYVLFNFSKKNWFLFKMKNQK